MDKKCKICRALGQKLFLKGDKCFSQKCPMLKRPYPPGLIGKRRKIGGKSEFGKQLSEKQKLKKIYGLRERQFKKYVNEIIKKRGKIKDDSLELIKKLESRLDNVIFRLGLAKSRKMARQLVLHKFFLVNNKPVNIPSYNVKVGDEISLKESKKNKKIIKEILFTLEKKEFPSWVKFDKKKITAKIIKEPSIDISQIPVEIPLIFEFYSR